MSGRVISGFQFLHRWDLCFQNRFRRHLSNAVLFKHGVTCRTAACSLPKYCSDRRSAFNAFFVIRGVVLPCWLGDSHWEVLCGINSHTSSYLTQRLISHWHVVQQDDTPGSGAHKDVIAVQMYDVFLPCQECGCCVYNRKQATTAMPKRQLWNVNGMFLESAQWCANAIFEFDVLASKQFLCEIRISTSIMRCKLLVLRDFPACAVVAVASGCGTKNIRFSSLHL